MRQLDHLSFFTMMNCVETSQLYVAIAFGASGYLLLVHLFRYQRAKHNASLCKRAAVQQTSNSNGGAHATVKAQPDLLEAYRRTVADISNMEMPLVFRLSLEFALFRTYAIPSISGLTERTKCFQYNCGKRYDDTDLLIREIVENPFWSERSELSIRRINAIHGQFQKEINMDDMRYVLSVFVLEPIRWARRFEWRELTSIECDALLVTWTHIGKRMGITAFPATLEQLDQWNESYEKQMMLFAKSNVTIAEATMDLFLGILPWWMRSAGREVALCLMDDRLRAAFCYPDPNPKLKNIVLSLLWIRKMIVRHLFFPRPRWLTTRRTAFKSTTASSPTKVSNIADIKLCPRYHIYKPTYQDGYFLSKLGNAPSHQLYPDGKTPFYSAP